MFPPNSVQWSIRFHDPLHLRDAVSNFGLDMKQNHTAQPAREVTPDRYRTRFKQRVRQSRLEIEVLEKSALVDKAQESQTIARCRQIGVQFALDDFGTGHLSLTYLQRLRIVQIKIDQSFVRGMLVDPDDLAILKGVIGLARAF
jgi:EAL domain-containing protein (putative c-di-GMP-specific phosphodiesterase class I)